MQLYLEVKWNTDTFFFIANRFRMARCIVYS